MWYCWVCRYLGFKKTILLDRKRLVELLDLHNNSTLTWDQFAVAVKEAHERRTGAPTHRRVISDKPKEEDYFYANPQECLCEGTNCHDLYGRHTNYSSLTRWSHISFSILSHRFCKRTGAQKHLERELPCSSFPEFFCSHFCFVTCFSFFFFCFCIVADLDLFVFT